MNRTAGFTLIEMMVTVALVGILASVVVPLVQVSVQRSKERDLRIALREIRTAIDAYKKAGDEGRIYRSATTTGYPPTLATLVQGAADLKDAGHRKIFFLRRLPRDPMDPNNELAPERTWGLRSYASEAERPREGEDVYDIHSRSEAIGLGGTPYRAW